MKKIVLLLFITVFFIKPGRSLGQVNVPDSLALVDLYNSTSGSTNWTITWNLINPVNTWYGITLSADQTRVIGIHFVNNNIGGVLPSSISNLSQLKSLYLAKGGILTIPSILGQLSNLDTLDLSFNDLSGIIPSSLGQLSNLVDLNLTANQLTGTIPESLGQLGNLQSLDLGANGLTGPIPDTLKHLSQLTSFNLNSNPIGGNIPLCLGQLTNLEFLGLESDQLTGTIPDTLENLKQLTGLGLSDNKLTGSFPSFIGQFTYLTYADVSKNKLSGNVPDTFGNLVNLIELRFSDNQLSGPVPASIAKICTFGNGTLDILYLYDNEFTFSGVEAIATASTEAMYSPQAIIPLHYNSGILSVSAGGTLANDSFYWYRNNVLYKVIAGDSVLNLTQDGYYSVAITNTIVTNDALNRDLILYSDTLGVCYFSQPANLSSDTTICSGQNLVLYAGVNNASYLWNDNTTADSLLVTLAGKYWVEVMGNGCTYTDTTNVVINPSPLVYLGDDTTICGQGTVTLEAPTGPAYKYLWQNGSAGNSYSVSSSGAYWVKVTNEYGCSGADTVNIGFVVLPVFSLGDDTTVCGSGVLNLNVSVPNATYLWSTGSTAPSLAIDSSGLYWLSVNDSGCVKTDSITVNFQPLPVFSLGDDTTICGQGTVVLEAPMGAGSQYLWQDGSGGNSYSASNSGAYWVKVTNEYGCSYSDTVNIGFVAWPVFSLGDDTTICGSGVLNLNVAVPNATYLWSTGSTASSLAIDSSGLYWLSVNDSGCVKTDSIRVNFQPRPVFSLGDDTTICGQQSLVLEAPMGTGYQYLWQDGSAGTSYSASSSGGYWVKVTNEYGCSYTDTVNIGFVAWPVFSLGDDTTICGSGVLNLSVSVPNATYLWSTGSTASSLAIDSSGLYWLSVNDSGCVKTDSITVNFQPRPVFSLGDDTTICGQQSLVLEAPMGAGFQYLWQDGSAGTSYSASSSGAYWAEVTNKYGCSYTDTINVSFVARPVFSLGADTTLCDGEVLNLKVSVPNATYLWSTGSTASSVAVDSPGVYWLSVDDSSCVSTDSITVSFTALPIVSLGNDTTLCVGQSLVLNAPTGTRYKYLWEDGSTGEYDTVSSTGTYWVRVTNEYGCNAADTINVHFAALPVFSLGDDTTICGLQTVVLEAPAGAGYQYLWQDGSGGNSYSVSNSGAYWVKVSNKYGCSYADTVNIHFAALPVFSLGDDTTICGSGVLNLKVSVPNATYLWSTGNSSSSLAVDSSGLYWLSVTDNGCVKTDSIAVNFQPLPVFSLGDDTSICGQKTVVLEAPTGPGYQYLWQDGSAGNNYKVSSSGAYWTKVTDKYGCSYSDTVNVRFAALPVFSLGDDTTICGSGVLNLKVSVPNATYLWSTGSTASSLAVDSSGLYWLSVTDNGCVKTDSIAVNFQPLPVFSLGDDTTICGLQTVVLEAPIGAAYKYLWQDGSTGERYSISNNGAYWVKVTDKYGCSYADTVNVRFAALPVFSLGDDTTICGSGVLNLKVSVANATYLWSTGSTASSLAVDSSGLYWLSVTDNGCVKTDSITVNFQPLPVFSLGNDTTVCSGQNFVLRAPTGTGYRYLWQDGSTGNGHTVSKAGAYWLEVKNEYGCNAADTINIGFKPLPVFSLGNDTSLCSGQPLVLSVSVPQATYLWSTGSTSRSLPINSSGLYWLSVSDSGCVKRDSIYVVFKPAPKIALGNDTTLCEGQSLVLNAANSNATYLWQDGSTAPGYTVTAEGNYSVMVALDGCDTSGKIAVDYAAKPVVNLGSDTSLCGSEKLVLDASYPQASYLWQDGSTEAGYTVTQEGTYAVQVTNGCGSVVDTIAVQYGSCGCKLYVPSAFTPNGDGRNDVFRPMGKCNISGYVFKVYDRWGGAVFNSQNAGEGWDGNVQGKLQPMGTYVWELAYFDTVTGKATKLNGTVVLIR